MMNDIPKMVAPLETIEYATPGRASPSSRLLDQVLATTMRSGFDVDAWHVMDRRDDALIADEVANGATSGKFVYSFKVKGTEVAGVSVVGARQLAYEYGGIRSYLVSSVQKIGSLWLFRSYPHSGSFEIKPQRFRELDDEPDFYEILLEVQDLKSGNSIQVEKREAYLGEAASGGTYKKPHYITIAQAKAFRNGVLSLLPQDVILKFKIKNLPLAAKNVEIGEDVLAEKRGGVLRFAASKGIPLDRAAVQAVSLDQIAGLSDAAHSGDAAAFANAARAVGLLAEAETETVAKAAAQPNPKNQAKRQQPAASPKTASAPVVEPPHDLETGEIKSAPSDTPNGAPDSWGLQ